MILKKEGHLDIHFVSDKYTDEEKKKIIGKIHEKDFSHMQSKLKEFIHAWEIADHNKYSYVTCNPIIKVTIPEEGFIKLELSSLTGKKNHVHMHVQKILNVFELLES